MNESLGIIQSYCQKYKLNEEQASVVQDNALKICLAYSNDESALSNINPISLVHGPFGSGKSLVLGVLIIVLYDLKSHFIDEFRNFKDLRVLVCSMTNAAVDRVLLSVLRLGFNELVRVGNPKRVSKLLVPFLSKNSTSNFENDYPSSEAYDQTSSFEKDYFSDEEFYPSDKNIDNSFLVGSTCLSAANPSLSSQSFPLILVDEVGQVPEYMTLIPITRLNCQFIVLVGDPEQLPPTVSRKSDSMTVESGLGRSLFDRMALLGNVPKLLSTQYRCHPQISKLLNMLFYKNRLVDGISEKDRLSVFQGLPSMSFIDVYEGSVRARFII
ncbi:Protein ZGRF1 [Smittium mucronatum]|uniref:Protein ZGRF1 n=1 Tax=Smittium mucronatum TaxID=133383 RepID=A0A1R0GXX3_9FUNG|nr:Protein ZGRF1 [Smittium mucronatum]